MAPSDELLTRAVVKVIPEDLAKAKLASGKRLRIYNGVDPTGSKLHIGHTVPLRKLQAFADAGHEVIFLIGSFTAMIGDPSGRDEARVPLTREQIEENFKTYKAQASKILDFEKIRIVYNHEWLEKLGFEEIIKIASNFSEQEIADRSMFSKHIPKVQCGNCHQLFRAPISESRTSDEMNSIKVAEDEAIVTTCPNCGKTTAYFLKDVIHTVEQRPVGMHEMLYPLMQGYDSVMLDVDIEVGGNDQLFNMLCGRTLQKTFGKREKCVLTTRLIEGTDGRKMSKTYNNCIYLEDEPSDMFGKVMSIKDDLMETYFECCTDVPMEEVKNILEGKPRDAKARLASEIVALYHGAKAAKEAALSFDRVFKNKELPADMPEVLVKKGTSLIDALVIGKLASSKSEARRVIEQGGVKLNNKVVQSLEQKVEEGLTPEALAKGVVVQVGKRKFVRFSVR